MVLPWWPSRSALPSLASLLALVAAIIAAVAAVHMNQQFLHRPSSGPVDLMPLLLGAKAILAGLDPNEPLMLESVYKQSSEINVRVHGFHNYYPPTASALMIPASLLPYRLLVDLFYWGGMAALAGAAFFVSTTGPSRGRTATVAAGLAVASVFLQLRLARVVLPSGQVSPFVVLLTAMALWGLMRPKGWLGAVAFGLGAAIKYFPLVLLPAALGARRWRWLWATLVVVAALLGCMVLWRDGSGGLYPEWIFGASRFVVDPPQEPWAQHGHPWLWWLWQGRVLGLGAASLAMVAVAAWLRPDRDLTVATGGLLLAWGGAAMSGGHFYHEAIMILPALGFVLAWPAHRGPRALQWIVAGVILAAMIHLGAFARGADRNPPHWLPLAYLVWIGCALRWGWTLWARRGSG